MHFPRDKVVVSMKGGLGNQLFQYCTAKALSFRLEVDLILDLHWYLDNSQDHTKFILNRFRIDDETWIPPLKFSKNSRSFIYNIFNKISPLGFSLPVIREDKFKFRNEILNLKKPVFLDGYWQNENYFKNYRSEILNLISLEYNENKKFKYYFSKIHYSNSICMHIRRGDYISNSQAAKVHGIIEKEFYYQSLNRLSNVVDNPVIFIFSDDLDWVKRNLSFDYETMIVDLNQPDRPELDLILMSYCKNFIIANSSFSWWAAWLSIYQNKKIVAPKIWFLDNLLNMNMKLPKDWIRI